MKKFMVFITTSTITFINGLLVVSLLAPEQPKQIVSIKPNIIVIMVDDLDLGAYNKLLELGLMPNLQAYIASKGSTFVNYFVTNSLCCPSRATLLTGQYAHNHGVLHNEGLVSFNDTATLPVWLKAAGYKTALAGKYMNTYGSIDINKDGVIDLKDKTYIPPGWNSFNALFTPDMYNYGLNLNGTFLGPRAYQTDALAKIAYKFISENVDPVFVLITPTAPHVEVSTDKSDIWQWDIRPPERYPPVQAMLPQSPNFNEQDVSDKPTWLQIWPSMNTADINYAQRYYQNKLAAMRAVDDLIGTVVAALKDRYSNTVLIFTSDNGFLQGQHRLDAKGVPYEEAIKVPLVVRIPGIQKQIFYDYIINTDIAPGILDLASAKSTIEMDGTSFKNTMLNSGYQRKRFLIEHWGLGNPLDPPTYFGLRSSRLDTQNPDQTYVEYSTGEVEVYDLASDPYQMINLYSLPDPLQHNILNYLKSCKGPSCMYWEYK